MEEEQDVLIEFAIIREKVIQELDQLQDYINAIRKKDETLCLKKMVKQINTTVQKCHNQIKIPIAFLEAVDDVKKLSNNLAELSVK